MCAILELTLLIRLREPEPARSLGIPGSLLPDWLDVGRCLSKIIIANFSVSWKEEVAEYGVGGRDLSLVLRCLLDR